MGAKLSENDRRSVDLLLAGESADHDGGLSPAMLERVNSVRRLLGLLSAMPADEPSTGLADATLKRIEAAGQNA